MIDSLVQPVFVFVDVVDLSRFWLVSPICILQLGLRNFAFCKAIRVVAEDQSFFVFKLLIYMNKNNFPSWYAKCKTTPDYIQQKGVDVPNIIQRAMVIGLGVFSANAVSDKSYSHYPATVPATGHRDMVSVPPHELDCYRSEGLQICDVRLDEDPVTTPMVYCSVHLPGQENPSRTTAVEIQRLVYLGYDAFATAQTELRAAEVEHLTAWAKRNRADIESILIVATTDVRGDKQYNRELAYQRALSVYRHLSALGVSRLQISIQGKSFTSSDDYYYPQQHARLRRIELYQGGASCHSLMLPGGSS